MFALVLLASTIAAGASYAHMAPLGQYLIGDRKAEIALARSAAPAAISRSATVLVLTEHGYETAERGTNGFTCLVERSWDSPFDSPGFWNWRIRGPECYNPAASRTVLRMVLFRAKMAVAGASKSQMLDRTRAAIAANAIAAPELGSMSYMMSKQQYLGDGVKAWVPHLMVYTPKADSQDKGANWGADVDGSPVIFDTSTHVFPDPWTIMMIPVATWSDGSPAR